MGACHYLYIEINYINILLLLKAEIIQSNTIRKSGDIEGEKIKKPFGRKSPSENHSE
jgi:hypothetical protein